MEWLDLEIDKIIEHFETNAQSCVDWAFHLDKHGGAIVSNLTKSYAKYGAKPKNVQWSCSAIADDGAIVISCWNTKGKQFGSCNLEKLTDGGKIIGYRYTDDLSLWKGNTAGSNEVREYINLAVAEDRPVRFVLVTCLDDLGKWAQAENMAGMQKKFHVKPQLEGRVVEFESDRYVVEFINR